MSKNSRKPGTNCLYTGQVWYCTLCLVSLQGGSYIQKLEMLC